MVRKSDRLQDFLDANESLKGKFIGATHRDGIGISRIDDRWWECDDYFIEFDDLIEFLNNGNTSSNQV